LSSAELQFCGRPGVLPAMCLDVPSGAIVRRAKPVGAPKLPRMGVKDQSILIFSSLFVVGSFFWFPLLVYYAFRKCQTWKARFGLLIFVALVTLMPLSPKRGMRHNYLWKVWHDYFGTDFIYESFDAIAKDKAHLFAMIPHGIYPFGAALSLVGRGDDNFRNAKPVVAGAALRMPIFGHLIQAIGAVVASRKSISRALQSGTNLSMPTGGIAEIFLGSATEEVALLSRRKGFIKLAIQEGVPLVPVYVFGNSGALGLLKSSFLEWLSRTFRISVAPFVGRWGLPIPFRVPLRYAIGAPIPTVRTPKPTDAQVDAIQEQFTRALVALFEKHKGAYGWGDRKLKIV